MSERQITLNDLYQGVQGRLLLINELSRSIGEHLSEQEWHHFIQVGLQEKRLTLYAGIGMHDQLRWGWLPQKILTCRRCGSGETMMRWSFCATCQRNCPYCTACLQMGKIRSCSVLVHGRSSSSTVAAPPIQVEAYSPNRLQTDWGLSPAQADAASEALHYVQYGDDSRRLFLIWAVTGSGKTEMMFPLIDAITMRGGLVCIATPRKDVVVELAPRLEERFPSLTMAVLYGGSDPTWHTPALTLATTHQLLRFEHAFDLIVIDEVDAFPYHNDRLLNFAAERAVQPAGKRVFLSATPPVELRRSAAKGRLAHVKVPCRFHGYPLPVPQLIVARSRSKRWDQLIKHLKMSIHRRAQIFLFVSRINVTEQIVQALRRVFPNETIAGTSSVDSQRAEKVKQFRNREIRLLVTTTILERGVTVARSDVFVYEADATLFDEAALVQMAGRAGRKIEDPSGYVYFFAQERTRSIGQAIKQIKRMNQEANRKGFLR